MKTIRLLLLGLLFAPAIFQGQEEYVNSENFNAARNQFLSNTLTGDKDLSTLNSFASVNIVQPTLTVALTQPWYRNSNKKLNTVTTVNFSGGILEGTAKLVENENFNSDIVIQLEQPWIICSSLKYFPSKRAELMQKKMQADNLYELNVDKIERSFKKIENLIALILVAKQELERCEPDLTCAAQSRATIFKLEDELNVTRREIQETQGETMENKLQTLKDALDTKIKEIDLNAEWSSVKLCWFVPFAEYSTQKLYLYDTLPNYNNRLNKITPEYWKAGLKFNTFYDQAKKAGFASGLLTGLVSISYLIGQTNNTQELTSEQITTTKTLGTNDENNVRTRTTTVSAFNRYKYDSFNVQQLSMDINKKIVDRVHLHIFYEIKWISHSEVYNGHYQNLGGGLIVGFKDKSDKEKKSLLNLELFVKFNDVEDNIAQLGDAFYKRSTLGIRTTIPFGHLFKPKS